MLNFFSHQKAPSAIPGRKTSGIAAIFGIRPLRADCVEPLSVTLGVIGRGHAGKTALFNTIFRGTDTLPSGLQVDVEGPWNMAKQIKSSRETVELLRHTGLPATLDRPKNELHLFQGDTKCVTFSFREVIGQILTSTTDDSPSEQKDVYAEYVTDLGRSDVLWVVMPCPPREASFHDLERYNDDLRLSVAYLRESLRLRQNPRTCSVAIALTKLDSLFTSAEEAKSQLEKDHLCEVLRPLVNLIMASKGVGQAAIFPTSAFGFGNAVPRPVEQTGNGKVAEAPHNGKAAVALEQGETEWILRPGASPQPYNLTALVVWSMLRGMLYQDVEVDDDQGEHALAQICESLAKDLSSLDGWCVPLKGVRLSNE